MSGFTLLEVLISITIIAILTIVSAPFYFSIQMQNDLNLAEAAIAQTLRRAQVLSRTVSYDTPWGVYVENGAITLFKGLSFSMRDISFDEVTDLSSNLIVSGVQETIFTKLNGFPQTTGTITITSPNSESISITINDKGAISY